MSIIPSISFNSLTSSSEESKAAPVLSPQLGVRKNIARAVMYRLTLILPFLCFLQAAVAASFSCNEARSKTEKLICSNEALSKLDERLASAYRLAIASSGSKGTVTYWQREWLHSESVTGCDDAPCLKDAFTKRIRILKTVAPASQATSKWNGGYVRYYKGRKDSNTATLLLIGLSDNRIYISGNAIWIGPNAAIGQVNLGQIDSIGKVMDKRAKFSSNQCQGLLTLRGATVIVENESGCGGLNVYFNGAYRRR